MVCTTLEVYVVMSIKKHGEKSGAAMAVPAYPVLLPMIINNYSLKCLNS